MQKQVFQNHSPERCTFCREITGACTPHCLHTGKWFSPRRLSCFSGIWDRCFVSLTVQMCWPLVVCVLYQHFPVKQKKKGSVVNVIAWVIHVLCCITMWIGVSDIRVFLVYKAWNPCTKKTRQNILPHEKKKRNLPPFSRFGNTPNLLKIFTSITTTL